MIMTSGQWSYRPEVALIEGEDRGRAMAIGQDHSDRIRKIKFESCVLRTDLACSPEVRHLDDAESVHAV